MSLDQRIRAAESELYRTIGVRVDESYLTLARTGLRLRRIEHGSGTPVVLLHGVTLDAAAWAPLFAALPDFHLVAVELPGHGLSDPVAYRPGGVREHALRLMDDVFDALGLAEAAVVAHSLGAMFALWHAAGGANRIAALVAIGDPGVALPGARVRMPLSLLTVPGVGAAVLRSPSSRGMYRRLLALGLGAADAAAVPEPLVDALRLSARRPQNARTVASLMHAIDRLRRPRPESVLGASELARLHVRTLFVWGTDDPYLSAEDARPSIDRMPSATLRIVPGGHAPWLSDAAGVGELVRGHLRRPAEPGA